MTKQPHETETVGQAPQEPARRRPAALTEARITALKPEPGKKGTIPSVRIEWDHGKTPGLGVLITKGGHKSFVFQYRFRGRARRMTIGEVGVFTLADARMDAKQYGAAVARGEDPAELLRKKKAPGLTMANLWAGFLEDARDRLAPKTVSEYVRIWKVQLAPVFGSKLVDAITKEQVVQFHQKMRKSAPIAANRAVMLLSKLFTVAMKRDLITYTQHPVRGFEEWAKEGRPGRALTTEEQTRLLAALAKAEREGILPAPEHRQKPKNPAKSNRRPKSADTPTPADPYAIAAIRVAFLTGWRPGEILGMKHADVDLDHARLTLRTSKTGFRVHHVPSPVVRILRTLPKAPGNPFVFVSRSKPGEHIKDLKKLWSAVRHEARLEGVRLYDLRHTHTSTGERFGAVAMQQVRGHRDLKTTQRYLHVQGEHVRAVAEAVAEELHARMVEHGPPAPNLRLA